MQLHGRRGGHGCIGAGFLDLCRDRFQRGFYDRHLRHLVAWLQAKRVALRILNKAPRFRWNSTSQLSIHGKSSGKSHMPTTLALNAPMSPAWVHGSPMSRVWHGVIAESSQNRTLIYQFSGIVTREGIPESVQI
jgi:hypothetical protein